MRCAGTRNTRHRTRRAVLRRRGSRRRSPASARRPRCPCGTRRAPGPRRTATPGSVRAARSCRYGRRRARASFGPGGILILQLTIPTMRVAALVPYHEDYCAGQRFRVETWARHLRVARDLVLAPAVREPGADVGTPQARPASEPRAAAMLRCCIEQTARVLRESRPDVVYIYREAALVGPALIERLTPAVARAHRLRPRRAARSCRT